MGQDKVIAGYKKSEPGAGSDRVVSEMLDYADHYKLWPYRKSEAIVMRFDPVATAPGSDFV